ncbi:hypothetical protein RR48_00248 [Papilio machaon]|uniref:Uncharacterized protein n=1 Tax=Papilio machaon TaxID=76193 RepID=A0A0N0PFI9_PAPMA|nr:hypothetical protein RR48_00248 [Papilio machaon]
MYRADKNAVDIWEIATQVDKNVPANIWNIVSKMPLVNERQIIATSTREVALWKKLALKQVHFHLVKNQIVFI